VAPLPGIRLTSLLLVEERLLESEYLARRLGQQADRDRFGYHLNAFLAAARSATFLLQKELARVIGVLKGWSVDVDKRLERTIAMTAKRQEWHRAEKLGFHVDEPTKALTERVAPLERRVLSTANLHRAAWRLRLRQVPQAEIRDLGTLQMRKAAESPLRFAFGCFPPASPAFVPEVGKQKTTPKAPSQPLIYLKKIGAGEGIRTLDPDLGKVVLYP
jgi:hypothetical protein